ncbi:MAG: hypothetical protein ABIH28_00115, partial [archaeon]
LKKEFWICRQMEKETKDLVLKLLKLPIVQMELLRGHLGYKEELAQSVISSDFCSIACPEKRVHGKEFNWEKHCGHHLGESSCSSGEAYDSFYRFLKREGILDL